MREYVEGHTVTAEQAFHPARLARAASELWHEGSQFSEHKGLETEWSELGEKQGSSRGILPPETGWGSQGVGSLPLEEDTPGAKRTVATGKPAR